LSRSASRETVETIFLIFVWGQITGLKPGVN